MGTRDIIWDIKAQLNRTSFLAWEVRLQLSTCVDEPEICDQASHVDVPATQCISINALLSPRAVLESYTLCKRKFDGQTKSTRVAIGDNVYLHTVSQSTPDGPEVALSVGCGCTLSLSGRKGENLWSVSKKVDPSYGNTLMCR